MRQSALDTLFSLYEEYPVYTLLGDLGVFQCRSIFQKYPDRISNFGIMEQSMVSSAAGLSAGNYYPVIYSITPFLLDRSFEQIKLDLVYNKNSCLIITAGSSYDYSKLGPTHFCPHDISSLISIGFPHIYIPFTASDCSTFVNDAVVNSHLSYLRLSSAELNIIDHFPNHNLSVTNHSLQAPSFTLYRSSSPVSSLALLISPDCQYLPPFSSVASMDILCLSHLAFPLDSHLISHLISYDHVHLFAPFDVSGFLSQLLLSLSNRSITFTCHTVIVDYLDTSISKEQIFSDRYVSFSFSTSSN